MRDPLHHFWKDRAAALPAHLLYTAMAYARSVPNGVSLVLVPPYLLHADEVLEMSRNTLLSLQNKSFEIYMTYHGSTLDGNNSVNIQTRPEVCPRTPIELAPAAWPLLGGTEEPVQGLGWTTRGANEGTWYRLQAVDVRGVRSVLSEAEPVRIL